MSRGGGGQDGSQPSVVVMQEPGRTFILTNDASRSPKTGLARNNYAAPEIREAGRREGKHQVSRSKLEKLKSSVAALKRIP